MNIKTSAFIAIAASVVIGTAGCGATSAPSATTGTPVPSANATVSPADRPVPAAAPKPIAQQPAGAPQPVAQEPETAPGPAVVAPEQAAPQPVTAQEPAPGPAESAPNGSGHGMCFDVNSALANSAIAGLAPPPAGGGWTIESASTDPIQAGCSGVLSWMAVDWQGIHPGTHVLFFTNGTYLGTATSKPYGYTEVIGKTRNTVSVQYRWPKPEDALCCPQGGPSVVTFTLNGTSIQAQGQFPPDN